MGHEAVVLICDDEFGKHGSLLAEKLGARSFRLATMEQAGQLDADDVIIDVDLRNLKSVELVKHALDQVPTARTKIFLIQDGSTERLWRVQANALGATRHVRRPVALNELRRAYSVTGSAKPTPARQAALQLSPGGHSVASAGRSIETMFEALLGNTPVSLKGMATAGAEVFEAVRDVGTDAWLDTVRQHHEGTYQHCLLVTGVAAGYATGNRLNLTQAGHLMNAALLHDIGKATIPKHILDKPGALTEAERAVIERHTVEGHAYLAKNATVAETVLDAVLHHHEALDGTGYPHKLKGDEIKPLTRVVTVCDIFAALVEARPYKTTRTPAQAIGILIDMVIASKVDYEPVRGLAASFGVGLPADFADVVRSFSRKPAPAG